VKIFFTALACTTLLLCASVSGDDYSPENVEDLSAATMANSDSKLNASPFRISARADWISQANIDKKHHRHDHVKFHVADIKGEAVLYYNPCYEEGFGAAVDFSNVYFKWNKNPYFHRSVFNEVSLTLFGFTKRARNWDWQASVTMNWDTKYNNFTYYTNYDLVLWGRYDYCPETFGLHGGVLALTGMKIDKIYPIIGFDWKFNDRWKLNAVFPMNISLVYTFNNCWNSALAVRFFEVRRRVGRHERDSKGLIRYRNTGLELAINYEGDLLTANIHGGWAMGGQFVVSNKNNKNKHHYDLDSSGYVGGEVAVKF